MKKQGYIFLGLIIVMLFGFIIMTPVINSEIKLNEDEIINTNDYYDESPGIAIKGATNDIFTICINTLYFYNSSNNGSIYKVNLNHQPFAPTIVRGYLGNVNDISAIYGGNAGDLIFLATTEYNNAIMTLNTSTLVYQKIISSQGIPQKISVSKFFFIEIVAWKTISNAFYWNSFDQIVTSSNFYGVIDVQCNYDCILFYNSNEIRLYRWGFGGLILTIHDEGITSAFLDEIQESIIYAQDDDYDMNPDGKIIQYDYDNNVVKTIKTGVDYPIDVWCTQNYIYWLERGYWSTHSMIYRYSYYYQPPDTHYYSKVSRAHGVNSADKIEFQWIDDLNQHNLGVYWGYNQLFVINGSDITPPDKIDWAMSNATKTYNQWSVDWWNSWDLNGIENYELRVSNTPDFVLYDTYWITEDSYYSIQRYEFSDMVYGNYYYLVRAIDTMANDPTVAFYGANIGEWSTILHISYPIPKSEQRTKIISGYSILLIELTIGIITIPLIIKLRRRDKI